VCGWEAQEVRGVLACVACAWCRKGCERVVRIEHKSMWLGGARSEGVLACVACGWCMHACVACAWCRKGCERVKQIETAGAGTKI